MKVDERRCDACGDAIGTDCHLRVKRTLFGRVRLRLYDWGLVDIAPVDTGWRTTRPDICGDCWDEVLKEVGDRVGGDD